MMSRLIFVALNVADLEQSTALYRAAFDNDFHGDRNKPDADPWCGSLHRSCSWTDGGFLHIASTPRAVSGAGAAA